MQRFDARAHSGPLGLVGGLPPVLMILAVLYANGIQLGDFGPREMALLLAFAAMAPVAALAWMVGAVAAYSVAPGELVVHRVVCDRRYALASAQPLVRRKGVISVVTGSRQLRLFAVDSEEFLAAIGAATRPAEPPPGGRAVDGRAPECS